MSRIIDITDKLNFEEKPKLKIKDFEIEVNDEATVMLQVMPLSDDATAENIIKMINLLFNEADKEKLDSLNLNTKDFITVVRTAISLVTGVNQGETQTLAMT